MLKTLALSIWFIFHPVHVTLTSIDQVRGTDSLSVFVRMYYDDFLLDYRKLDTKNDSIGNISAGKLFPARLMNKYLEEKVTIIVNNKELKGKLLNLALADNEISVILLYKSVKKPKVITVRNLIMTGLYGDQANMTIVRVNDFEEGVKLTSERTEQTFKLKNRTKQEVLK
jgi:hypothetical protein